MLDAQLFLRPQVTPYTEQNVYKKIIQRGRNSVVRPTTLLNEGRGKIYRSLTASRHCPPVLPVKAGWKQGTTFDSADGTVSN